MSKTINRNNCIEIGYIKRTHGVSGGVMAVMPEGMADTYEQLKYIFIEIDGLLAPFFIKSISVRSDITATIEFESINSQVEAKEYIGCKLFTERENIVAPEDLMHLSLLVGYTLMDKSIGQIGEITEVNNYGGNCVLTTNYHNREVLIPLSEDLIVKIDSKTLVLIMDLPEGLL